MWWSVHLEGGPRRVNHAAVAVGDRIFSFGGYCEFTVKKLTFIFKTSFSTLFFDCKIMINVNFLQ